MRRFAAALALALALGSCAEAPRGESPPPAESHDLEGAPDVLLFATQPAVGVTTLHRASPGKLSAPLVTLSHDTESVVRAAVHPNGDVIATLDPERTRDRSFASVLLRLSPSRGPARLVDRVVYASRPVVSEEGLVYVARGEAGSTFEGLRVDDLTVEEVDPASGAARTLLSERAFLLHVAGVWEREVLVYRVLPGRASILAVSTADGAVRLLADVPDQARDFSIAGGDLAFQDVVPGGERGTRQYATFRLPIAGGPLVELARSPTSRLAPAAWPGEGTAISDVDGLAVVSSPGVVRRLWQTPRPSDEVEQLLSFRGALAAGVRHRSGAAPVAFVIATDGRRADLPAPSGARVAVAGFSRGGW